VVPAAREGDTVTNAAWSGSELEAIRRRESRSAAVARTAANVASRRSLPATLEALAREIQANDGLVGVQVLTNEHDGQTLHLLGSAGFPSERPGAFFAKLMACRDRGANLKMLSSFASGETVVVPHRYQVVMTDPAWEPLREYHRSPEWDSFVSVPIKARDEVTGVLNVYLAPGEEVDQDGLDFLAAMAEQAGLAIDYARLLERERDTARREERRSLAADLHDSVVQQVFSMGMLAHTLGVLTDGAHQDVSKAHQLAEDLQNITEDVLADLRSMVTQLRPVRATGDGLVPALQELAARTHRQTGTEVRLDAPSPVPDLDPDLVEDVFLIAAEAIRNAVKHAQAFTIHVAVETPPGRLLLTVHDAGGPDPAGYGTTVPYPAAASAAVGHDVPHDGAGLSIMRQRGERWGGSVDIDLDPVDGGSVSVSIPLATPTSETEQA
jgi:signal transduction histidine kinase